MANEQNNFENDKVSGLLSSLKRVETPGDFDIRVRSRIASGHQVVTAAWLPSFGKVAVTLVLVAAVAGYFGFRSFRATSVDEASVVNVPVVDNQAVAQNEDKTDSSVISSSKAQVSDPMAVQPAETRNPRESEFAVKGPVTRTVSSTRGGGTRVDASRIPNVITAPDHTRHLTKDVLSGLGIDAGNTGTGWTVGEVKQNSRAERSGLRAGDVIESVKNKTVRVRRDGKAVQIDLKP